MSVPVQQPRPSSARPRDTVAFSVVVAVIAALAALPTGLVILLSGGGPIVVVAALFALIPVGPLVAAYLWLDRYEPEPRVLLALALAWGACVATFMALVAQEVGTVILSVSDQESATVIAPITEEFTKGLFLVLLLIWRRHELDGVLDGIVYAGMVGIGFAFTENILYLAVAWNGSDGQPGGFVGLTSTFVVRCLASPFAHPLFTACIGVGIGLAINSRGLAGRLGFPVLGYVLAVLCHAAWNSSALLAGGSGFIAAYVIVMLPAFFLAVGLALWIRGREEGVLAHALDDAARRGFLPTEHIPYVVDLGRRRAWRQHARIAGGPVAARAVRDYQQAAIELGYLHHRFLRGTAPRDFAVRGQAFVELLQHLRPAVALPPAAAGVHIPITTPFQEAPRHE
jgi:RsiW-degrading membrane proteinase PrsW (M82 family)